MPKDVFESFARSESYGGEHGYIKVEIKVSTHRLLTEEETEKLGRLCRDIDKMLIPGTIAQDQEMMNSITEERQNLLAVFPENIFVEEIPNEYSSDPFFQMRPWFKVTTPIGHFKIGWRKRVINIDWSETRVRATADDLFPNDKVTKSGCSIHANSYDDARVYIAAVIAKYHTGVYMSSAYIDQYNFLMRDVLGKEGRELTAEQQTFVNIRVYQECQHKVPYEKLPSYIMQAVKDAVKTMKKEQVLA